MKSDEPVIDYIKDLEASDMSWALTCVQKSGGLTVYKLTKKYNIIRDIIFVISL